MSAAASPALEKTAQRGFPRLPIHVPVDLIALRSGVPETLPGRCTDISEAGLGAIVAGELTAGQQVAVELRLPNVGVPVRARALVRYQSRLQYGLEFSGLSLEQRQMIRYWIHCSAPPVDLRQQSFDFRKQSFDAVSGAEPPAVVRQVAAAPWRKIRIGRRRLLQLLGFTLLLAALAWWRWQSSWSELETHAAAAGSPLRISSETMEKRIVTKVDPLYPEAARKAGTEGLVVLDAVIAPDGSVKSLRPVSGPAVLVRSATEAVQAWKFEPYLSSGKPVEVETPIAVEFRIN